MFDSGDAMATGLEGPNANAFGRFVTRDPMVKKSVESLISTRSDPIDYQQFGEGMKGVDLSRAKIQNEMYHQNKKNFTDKITKIFKEEFSNESLINIVNGYIEECGIDNMYVYELVTFLQIFKKIGAFQELLDIYEKSDNDSFKTLNLTQELCAVAYNKIGKPDKAISVCNNLVKNGVKNGEIMGILGKAQLLKGDIEASYDAYNEGFLIDFETYPGINTAYRLLDMGRKSEAVHVAKMVYLGCERDGGLESGDYWCCIAMLESACICGKEEGLMDIVNKVLSLEDNSLWQLESTLRYLEPLLTGKDETSDIYSQVLHCLKERFELMKDIDGGRIQQGDLSTAMSKCEGNLSIEKKLKDPITHIWEKISYRYGYEAQKVKGNFDFEGGLYDHSITSSDHRIFTKLLDQDLSDLILSEKLIESQNKASNILSRGVNKLSEIETIDEFSETVDLIVRSLLNTEILDLENMHGDGHYIFDQQTMGLIYISGISKERKGTDSRTNISTTLALGLGDCRHHAQVKQLLFDMWQRQKVNKLLTHAYKSSNKGNEDEYNEWISNINEFQKEEIRTVHFKVEAPIQMEKMYKPVLDPLGNYIEDQTNTIPVEEHTMNVIVTKGDNGRIIGMRFADSFYQNHYKWAEGEMDFQSINGQKGISGKKIQVSGGKEVDVILSPVEYSAKVSERLFDDDGQMWLLGVPVGNFGSESLQMQDEMSYFRQRLMSDRYV